MKAGSQALRIVEYGLLLLGVLLLVVFAIAHIDRFIKVRGEMARFEAKRSESAKNTAGKEVDSQTPAADYSLWSAQRTKLYQATLGKPIETLAVLRIPTLHLEVPVLEGTDEFTLNRGVGRIAGTSRPGDGGNVGIAGHRDGFFRSLKDIRKADTIEVVTTSGTDVYLVDQIKITRPDDVSVLQPRTRDSLTLVTCYPFYFVGPAPKRYVVEATLQQSTMRIREQAAASLLLQGENQ